MTANKYAITWDAAGAIAADSSTTLSVGPITYFVGNGIVSATPGTADTVAFTSYSGTLADSAGVVVLNAIQDFRLGDAIDLTADGYVAGSTNLSAVAGEAGVLQILGLATGSAILDFRNSSLAAADFTLSSDGSGGTLLQIAPSAPVAYWLAEGAGIWNNAAGWLSGQVPNSAAIVNILGTYTPIPLSLSVANQQAAAVLLDVPNSTLTVTGGLTVSGTLTVASGLLSLRPGATLVAANLRMQAYTGLTLSPAALLVLKGGSNAESEPGTPALEADWSTTLSGATLDALSGSLLIGSNTALAQGEVTAIGATVTADLTALGNNAQAYGALTIDGGSWTDDDTGGSLLSGDMIIGDTGQGDLTLTGGGVLTDERDALFGSPDYGPIGTGGIAAALVTDGGRWLIAGNMLGDATATSAGAALLTVGTAAGGAGTVSVHNFVIGMTVDINGGGFSAGSVTNSSFAMTGGSLSIGGLMVGGTLQVAGGAVVQVATASGGAVSLDAASSVTIGLGTAAPGQLFIGIDQSATLDGGFAAPTLDLQGILTGGTTTLSYAGAIAGSGTLVAQSDLSLTPSTAFAATIVLADESTLTLAGASLFHGTVDATWQIVSANDASTTVFIDLPDLPFATANAIWQASEGIASLGTLAPFSVAAPNMPMTQTGWALSDDGAQGSLITFDAVAACYVAGTRIATPDGPRDIATLRPGDAVLVRRDTGWVAEPVRWIGCFDTDPSRVRARDSVAPVLIRADALADGVPSCDLRVSPDHALWLDGALVPARLLVNGASITRARGAGRVRYVHIELERHGIVLAEGVPAETFLDTGNRAQFTIQLGAGGPVHRAAAVAPLLLGGPAVARRRAALRARALRLGWRWRRDPAPLLLADGVALPLARRARLNWHARVPPGARRLTMISRHFVPVDLDPAAEDRRQLGLAVVQLALDGAALTGHAGGWHAAEAHWRWTDGAASIALPGSRGVLTLRCADAAPGYWAAPRCAQSKNS